MAAVDVGHASLVSKSQGLAGQCEKLHAAFFALSWLDSLHKHIAAVNHPIARIHVHLLCTHRGDTHDTFILAGLRF